MRANVLQGEHDSSPAQAFTANREEVLLKNAEFIEEFTTFLRR